MRKNIIISGVQGSGKSHIAYGFKLTKESVFETSATNFIYESHRGDFISRIKHVDLIIIDECSLGQIIKIENRIVSLAIPNIPPIIYLTQATVSVVQSPFEQFHVINCNNDIFLNAPIRQQ